MEKDILIPNFSGRINESKAENLLALNEAYKAQNVNCDDGNLNICKGVRLFTTAVRPSAIESMMVYYKNDVPELLVASSGKLYKLSNNTFVEIYSGFSSNNFDGVNFKVTEDVLIFGNGDNETKIYNGTTITNLKNRRPSYDANGNINGYFDADGVLKATEAEVTTLAPKSRFLDLHYERIWAADKNTVYFSTADRRGFDPSDWTVPVDDEEVNMHGGSIEMYTNDGGVNIGLKVIFDDVLIFRTKNIFKIFGNYPGNYQKTQIFSASGAIADKSIAASNIGAFFLNKDAIYLYNGTGVAPISEKIKATYSTINKSYIQNSVGIFYNDKYIVAVPEGTSTVNNLIIVYNAIDGTFDFIRGFTVTEFAEFQDTLIFSSTDGKVYEFGADTTFNGQPITSFWEGGLSPMGALDTMKEVGYIYVAAKGTGQLKVICTTEKATKEKLITLTPSFKIHPINMNNRGRFLKFRFENVAGSTYTIQGDVQIKLDIDKD